MFELLLLKKKTSSLKNVGFGIISAGWGGSGVGFISQAYSYNYVTDALAGAGNLSVARNLPCATSNGTYGLFTGGNGASGFSVINDKYTFATLVFSTGTNLSTVRFAPAANSTTTQAVISGGSSVSTTTTYSSTLKYEYSSNVISSGSNITAARMYLTAAGNTDYGVFESGFSNGVAVNVVDVYRYSTNAVSQGTASGVATYGKAAAGNKEYAVFAGGYGTLLKATEKYMYATHTRITSAQMLIGMSRHFGCGNEAVALFGDGTNTNKFSLVNQSYTTGSSLGRTGVGDMAAASSSPGWMI